MTCLIALLICASALGCNRPVTRPAGAPERPNLQEVAREFGFGASQDPAEDARLRKLVVGKWVRAHSNLVTLEFHDGGELTGTGWLAAYPSVGGEEQAKAPFQGRWEINDGRLRVHGTQATIVRRIRMPDDKTIQLFDMPERIDQGYVYHRR